jgi:threonylcarbamoyladenosine tRNA methylthiotransferase MtaB
MPRVSFHTLGCKLNYAETSTLARGFEERGFEQVGFGEASDVTVVNTCTVTEEAERKCRQAVRRALRANPDAYVVVTGCYAQLRPEEIARIDGVAAVLGAQDKFRLFHLLGEHLTAEALRARSASGDGGSARAETHVSCLDDATGFGPAYASGERTRAFLKIQDGCDYTCAFCTIPQARGRSRSAQIPSLVRQAEALAEEGYREIVLTGVNIGLFGNERGQRGEAQPGDDLMAHLRALGRVEGIRRYRISSIEPNLVSDKLVRFVAGHERFVPHFHMPLQSGDDAVLGAMRRRYRTERYASRVALIRRLMPHASIGVDVIVGFPAETPERFENTVRFLSDLPVSYLHVFTYSERPGTHAVEALGQTERLGERVPKPDRRARNRRLRELSARMLRKHYASQRGQVREVLWEGDPAATPHPERLEGFTDTYVRVSRPYDPERIGTTEAVRLGDFREDGTLAAEDAAFVSLL